MDTFIQGCYIESMDLKILKILLAAGARVTNDTIKIIIRRGLYKQAEIVFESLDKLKYNYSEDFCSRDNDNFIPPDGIYTQDFEFHRLLLRYRFKFIISTHILYAMTVEQLQILIREGALVSAETIDVIIKHVLCEKGRAVFELTNKEFLQNHLDNLWSFRLDSDNPDFVRLLVEYGMKMKWHLSIRGLGYYVRTKNLAVLRILFDPTFDAMSEYDLYSASREKSIFSTVMSTGDTSIVECFLLRDGPNVTFAHNLSVFDHVSAINFDGMVRFLIQVGANPNKGAELILCRAIRYNAIETFRYLLDHNASPFKIDRKRRNAFTVAVEEGKEEFVREILKRYGNLRHSKILFFAMKQPKITKILVEAGADLEIQDCNGDTVLKQAIRDFKYEYVKLLLDLGAFLDKEWLIDWYGEKWYNDFINRMISLGYKPSS